MIGRTDLSPARGRQRWRRRLSIAGAVLALGLITLWLLFQHKPNWYHPVELNPAGLRRTQNETTATADLIGDQLVRGRPFDVTFSDDQVTRWLTGLPEMVPEAQLSWPTALRSPAVHFEPGRIRAGVVYEGAGWRSLMGLSLRVELSPEEDNLRIALESTSVGSLPVPRIVVARALARPLERFFERAAEREVMPRLESVDQLYEGVPVRNRFVWPNGKREFRIQDIRFEDRSVRITIEPI